MAFKYINPGYAELLSVRGGTTVSGEQYSKTGVSFWQPTSDKGLTISEFPAELYGKLDLYFKAPENADRAKLTLAIGGYIIFSAETSRSKWRMKGNNNNDIIPTSDSFRVNAINTLWFQVKPSQNHDGIFRAILNEREVCNKQDCSFWYAYSSSEKTITVYSRTEDILISNFILSDEEVSPREQVIMLPVQATQTNMTDCGDGSYEATAANQEILQTVDVATLLTQYDTDSRVTGISLLGNPAYRTAEGLCALTAIEKSGGNVTTYGRHIAEQNPTSIVMDGRKTSLRISELSERQFGWRAGT
ncbi:hypothetical protein [uncultured Selenomonas sp.]|uniref:hypothetical protein n=1 Tax=uncultured Selenomonas sp. TaxID=159275 RepID=UPI0026770C03|nr:hypothetical protein [uncultured Selenomonas sp.]